MTRRKQIHSNNFSDVFVTEKGGELPMLRPKNVPRLDKVEITCGIIRTVIHKLK